MECISKSKFMYLFKIPEVTGVQLMSVQGLVMLLLYFEKKSLFSYAHFIIHGGYSIISLTEELQKYESYLPCSLLVLFIMGQKPLCAILGDWMCNRHNLISQHDLTHLKALPAYRFCICL